MDEINRMNKITRVLMLLSRLLNGDEVKKDIYCIENECSSRAFDRDVEDIRIYLSEIHSSSELVYDRIRKSYSLTGCEKQILLDKAEFLFIKRILRDSHLLTLDEYNELLVRLLSISENEVAFFKETPDMIYTPSLHSKSLLRIQSDLELVIKRRQKIKITYCEYDEEIKSENVIPYLLKVINEFVYLVAFGDISSHSPPKFVRIDRIICFNIEGIQAVEEKEYIEKYALSNMKKCSEEKHMSIKKEFVFRYPIEKIEDICKTLRDFKILSVDEHYYLIQALVEEYCFMKWLMSQQIEDIEIIEPNDFGEKIIKETKMYLLKYGGNQYG